jgi:transcriptional regulator with GAF, ATPase, and Fis domain
LVLLQPVPLSESLLPGKAPTSRLALVAHTIFNVPHVPDEVVQVAETFATLARTLAEHHGDLQSTLETIVNLAVESLDACDFAGIFLVEKGEISSPASSNDIPRRVDEIQAELGEGPCVDAIKEREVFRTGELTNETRWPKFSDRAHEETGIRSILSIRLFVEEDTMGALNLYSTAPEAFDDGDVALASVFAAHASVAMAAAHREETLEQKAQSRDLIGRAKGILMAQSGVTEEQAFDMLRRASQRMNVKVRDIAQRMTEQMPASNPAQ